MVLPLRSPIRQPEDLAKLLDYIFVDKCYEEKVRPLMSRGVPCLSPEFIAEYLFEVRYQDSFCIFLDCLVSHPIYQHNP